MRGWYKDGFRIVYVFVIKPVLKHRCFIHKGSLQWLQLLLIWYCTKLPHKYKPHLGHTSSYNSGSTWSNSTRLYPYPSEGFWARGSPWAFESDSWQYSSFLNLQLFEVKMVLQFLLCCIYHWRLEREWRWPWLMQLLIASAYLCGDCLVEIQIQ